MRNRKLKSTTYTRCATCIWVHLKYGTVSPGDIVQNLRRLWRSIFLTYQQHSLSCFLSWWVVLSLLYYCTMQVRWFCSNKLWHLITCLPQFDCINDYRTNAFFSKVNENHNILLSKMKCFFSFSGCWSLFSSLFSNSYCLG